LFTPQLHVDVKATQNMISRSIAQHAHPEKLKYNARRLVADDAQEFVMHPVIQKHTLTRPHTYSETLSGNLVGMDKVE
jgi:hypothetical protein